MKLSAPIQKRHTPTQAPLPERSQEEFHRWISDLGHLDREAAKRELLRDLNARQAKAADYAAEAYAGMDAEEDDAYDAAADRFHRALARYWYRGAQITWTERRPVGAVCPYCGDEEAVLEPSFARDPLVVSCLRHIDGVIRFEAEELFKRWANAGSEDGA
ncbi:MAG TPA: hypothetical protein VNM48_11630 [Chloroflexota bacterium]|nr:hypothetical protein [Chloroflexota bacterium]